VVLANHRPGGREEDLTSFPDIGVLAYTEASRQILKGKDVPSP
jgi:hypothetical protein